MNNRIRFCGLIVLTLFVVLLARLGYWQLIRGSELSARADNQHFDTLEIPGSRGEIKAGDGTILAGSITSYLLYAYKPNISIEPVKLSERLAGLLTEENVATATADELREKQIKEKYRELVLRLERDSVWEPLGKNLSLSKKELVESFNISGLGFQLTFSRYYPEASMSAHLLGFVGNDAAGNQKGYFGLEGYYDRELKGRPGVLRQEKDAGGNPIMVGSFQELSPIGGRSITLHLDRYLQAMIEDELKNALDLYGASAGEVVVMDPMTGAILASASYGNYDPGNFGDFDEETYRNPVISDAYEPGSTFKVLVMAAALEERAVKPDTKCDICDGPIKIGKYYIKTWDDQYHPDLSMSEVIVHSDNTGMVFAGLKLGADKLVEYLKKFGIGQQTGIDLQEEVSPSLREKLGNIDVATASFGQGVAVTTIQMLRAVGVIANGGVMMTPQVVSSIDGVRIKPKESGRVISEKTAGMVKEMMVEAVINGEAKFAAPKDYRIAGKTGTAQIPVAGHYDEDKTIVSFVGFAPADDPKFVMITKLREPTSSPWGSETAAPLWFKVAKKLLAYWKIPPSGR